MRSLDINPEPLLMFNDFLVIYIQLCEVEIPILILLHFIQTVMAKNISRNMFKDRSVLM